MSLLCRLSTLLFISMLVGCSSGRSTEAGLYSTLKSALAGDQGYRADPKQISEIPYASVLASIGDGPQGLLILAGINGDSLRWVSNDGVSLVTRNGRLVQIGNYRNVEVNGFRSAAVDPLPQMHRQEKAAFQYRVDVMPGYRENVPVDVVLVQQGLERVRILGIERELMHVVETLSSPGLAHKAQNHYWLDPTTAYVWKSVQAPVPGVGTIQLIQAKPYNVGR